MARHNTGCRNCDLTLKEMDRIDQEEKREELSGIIASHLWGRDTTNAAKMGDQLAPIILHWFENRK